MLFLISYFRTSVSFSRTIFLQYLRSSFENTPFTYFFFYHVCYKMKAVYHLKSVWHTLWLTNTTENKGIRCVWRVGGTDTSCKATGNPPLCLSTLKTMPNGISLRSEAV